MIDVYRFINSKDVAAHLRAIGHEFTASQAAYLVHKCEDATLAERIDAWRDIISEMPDERPSLEERGGYESIHEIIGAHIADKEEKLHKFLGEEGAVYFPYESRWSEKPKWVSESWCIENGLWNTLTMPVPFSSLDKCKDYLKHEGRILEKGWRLDTLHKDISEHIGQGGSIDEFESKPEGGLHYDRHVVCRVEMDQGWYNSYGHINDPEPQSTPLDYVILDGDYEIMDVFRGWRNMLFDFMVLAIPFPFKKGDIVIDRSARAPQPFVFSFAIPWRIGDDGIARIDHEKRHALSHAQYNDLSREISASNIRAYYDWMMTAYGYEIEDGTGLVELKWCGASRNYLNLEYYDGPLDGDYMQLAIISEVLRGELSCGEASNFNRCAALGNRLKTMLR